MMTTVPSTPASYGVNPLQILSRGPEYFRNSNLRSSGSESRRKTAAERLEADKCKYVKSEEVRQRRFTLELRTSSPPNNDSTSAQSMGTASTGSPANMEEDDAIGDFTEAIMQSMDDFTPVKDQNSTSASSNSHRIRSSSENAGSKSEIPDNEAQVHHNVAATRRQKRLRNMALRSGEKGKKSESGTSPSPLVTRLRDKLHNTASSHSGSAVIGNARTPSPSIGKTAEDLTHPKTSEMKSSETELKYHDFKTASPGNALNNYFCKAKEGVASLRAKIGLDKDSGYSKERQSRSEAVSSGRRSRSASTGPNFLKSVQPPESKNISGTKSDDKVSSSIMSPRTQLKHVRQNLKKVKIGAEVASSRQHTNSGACALSVEYAPGLNKTGNSTFVFNPLPTKQTDNSVSDTTVKKNGEATVESKPPLGPRRRKEKENIEQNAHSESQPKYFEVLNKRSSSSLSSKEENKDSSADAWKEDGHRSSSHVIKKSSHEVLQSSENTTAHAATFKKSSADETSATKMETEPSNALVLPKQRRPRSYQQDQRKDAMQPFKEANAHLFEKTGSRKSVAEAIEEIINPVLQDRVEQNRKSATSPDIGSTDENTMVANRESFYGNWSVATTFGTGSVSSKNLARISPVTDKSNFATGRIPTDEALNNAKSDSSDKLRSAPHTRSKTQNWKEKKSSTELSDSPGQKLPSKPPSFFEGPSNPEPLRHAPMHQHSAPTGTNDVCPESEVGDDGQAAKSHVLAPKSRREVVPDYRLRSHTHNVIGDTLKSQTSSSASTDANKPFTALTASDLKPRSNRQLHTVQPQSAPLRPTFAIPGRPVSQARHNPKRHTTTPVSPTLSPNKQPARMTPPPHTPTRSCSSTPYSSLKRTPASSRSSSLKRNRHRGSKQDIFPHQNELDRFFSTMGMNDYMAQSVNETIYSNHWSSDSDFSFAGASAYVRDSPDEAMDVDVVPPRLALKGPQSVSIIEKNARVMRWLMACQKNRRQSASSKLAAREGESPATASQSPPVSPSAREPMKPSHQLLPTRKGSQPGACPPPVPPKTYQKQFDDVYSAQDDAVFSGGLKESNV